MPIHDWTRTDAGLFHAFRLLWSAKLCDVLNGGILPPDYFVLPERHVRDPIPDWLTFETAEAVRYAARADQLTIRHQHGKVVAVVEIVSPGNKASHSEIKAFVEKAAKLIHQGVHLLVIDLFPPGPRDTQGIHKLIWDEFEEEPLDLPTGKSLTLASYDAAPNVTAYVEFVGVGDALPDMPLFLRPEHYVPAPLDASYAATWAVFPKPMKRLLE
ncbi:MAG: DUF4058 family protein [Gemmataceae bacterium]